MGRTMNNKTQDRLRNIVIAGETSNVNAFLASKIAYIKKAPSLSGNEVRIHISKRFDMSTCRWWHKYIQPEIRKLDDNADQDWRWPNIYRYTEALANYYEQEACGYTISIHKVGTPTLVPVALLRMVSNYICLDQPEKQAPFIWYMSRAPASALQKLEISDRRLLDDNLIPKMMGQIMLDTALIHSIRYFYQGNLGLHADPKGGTQLFEWYKNQGMNNIPIPQGYNGYRTDDGRYFCYNSINAIDVTAALDDFRFI